MDFTRQLEEIAKLRKHVEDVDVSITELNAVIAETSLAKELEQQKAAKNALSEVLADLITSVKASAVTEYDTTKVKDIVDGLSVKINHEYFYDIHKATEWAKKNAPTMIVLDETAFKKHAKAVADTLPLRFVTITEKPTAVISTDLSRYLHEETS